MTVTIQTLTETGTKNRGTVLEPRMRMVTELRTVPDT